MSRRRVLLLPDFRSMEEVFDADTLERLESIADIVWGRDGPMPPDEFLAALPDVDAVVFGTWHYGWTAIRRAGARLRAVLEVAGGHSHRELDYEWLLHRGIPIGSCAPAFGPAVAEMALALTLAAGRRVITSDRRFRAGNEAYLHSGNVGATSLYGKRVGFVGCGGLSRALQPLLEPFEVSVHGYDPWLADADFRARGIERATTLEDIFDVCDVVYVLAVPTPANERMITRAHLERLAATDIFVLMSRAHVVDFDALTALLVDGRFLAGIDVFPIEPLPADHPVRRADNAVLTAHLAGALPDALHEIGRMVVADLTEIFAGRPPSLMRYADRATLRRLTGS